MGQGREEGGRGDCELQWAVPSIMMLLKYLIPRIIYGSIFLFTTKLVDLKSLCFFVSHLNWTSSFKTRASAG